MSTRRDFLVLGACAVTAATVLPIAAANAAGHPDADLIRTCADFIVYRTAFNESSLDAEESPVWPLYLQALEAISAARATTIEGLQAKARAAKEEAKVPDGEDIDSVAREWSWDVINDLAAMGSAGA